MEPQNPQHRILIVSDRQAVSEDLHRILMPAAHVDSGDSERAFQGELIAEVSGLSGEIHATCHGAAAVSRIRQELQKGRRFALAYVDVKTAEGFDGLETVRHLLDLDPDLQLAVITDSSDGPRKEIVEAFGVSDRLLIAVYPFDPVAILQTARMAVARFDLDEQLNHQQDDLEKLVGQRTEDLREARDLARRDDEVKGRFLANMSHEIRTPLNAILGMSELLLSTTLTSEQREYVTATHSSAQTLLAQLNDVLDLSTMESGELKIEHRPFSLRLLVEETITLMRSNATKKNLQLNQSIPAELPAMVCSDATRIRQILTNLISNAIRFTPTGSVDVSISITELSSASVDLLIHVSDTGVGISQQNIDRIFSAFVQSDESTTRLFGGTGLGLAISRQLAVLLGGLLDVESVQGEGATFTLHLTLPIAASAQTLSSAAANGVASACRSIPARKSNEHVRVLVVDDHPFNRLFARRSLEKLNCCVTIADNGKQAVEKYRNEWFDLILMDCLMPVMDGYTATKAIRQLEGGGNRRVPIIALTAQTMENDRARCMAADMDDFVCKPLSIETLQTTVERWSTPVGVDQTGRAFRVIYGEEDDLREFV